MRGERVIAPLTTRLIDDLHGRWWVRAERGSSTKHLGPFDKEKAERVRAHVESEFAGRDIREVTFE